MIMLLITISSSMVSAFGQFETYENLEYGFSIEYPSGWIIDDNLPQENPWIEIVAILPDQDYWSKGIYVNLWKNYFTVTPQEHLERHNENALTWCSSRSVENDGFTCGNYLLLNVKTTSIDDREAYLLEEVWTRTENDKSSEVRLYNLQVFDGNDIWTVLAEGVTDELNESDNSLIKIIDSFDLKNISQIQKTAVLSPLKQVAQGIDPVEVTCNLELVLIIKHNGSPACVKPETAEKLEERGWGGMPPPCCKDGIHSFEECAAAGNPVMESYPRQCRTADGKHFVEIIPGKEQCEIAGGLWGIWGNQLSATASCNPATSDVGKECTDSSQCQSFCQANEGAEINSEEAGKCYGYELTICMQEVRNGVVDAEWCQ